MAVSFIGWELGENHRHTTSHWQTLWLLNYLALSVSDEGYSRNESCALYLISTFLLRTIFIIFTIMINELNVLDDNTCTFTMFLHIFLKYGKVTSLHGLCSLLFFQKTTFCFINCFLFSWLLLCIATGWVLWCLLPLSTMFQLFVFIGGETGKTTNLSVTNFIT